MLDPRRFYSSCLILQPPLELFEHERLTFQALNKYQMHPNMFSPIGLPVSIRLAVDTYEIQITRLMIIVMPQFGASF
jgi:hypothetical protein